MNKLIILAVSFFFASCALPGNYIYNDTSVSIPSYEKKLGNNVIYYSPKEMKFFHLGLMESPNMRQSLNNIKIASTDIRRFNERVANDLDSTVLLDAIDETIQRKFLSISWKKDQQDNDSICDFFAYVDVQVQLGSNSGEITQLSVILYFLDKNGIYLGKVSAMGTGTVPYPAFSAGFKDAVNELSRNLSSILDDGLHFKTLPPTKSNPETAPTNDLDI